MDSSRTEMMNKYLMKKQEIWKVLHKCTKNGWRRLRRKMSKDNMLKKRKNK